MKWQNKKIEYFILILVFLLAPTLGTYFYIQNQVNNNRELERKDFEAFSISNSIFISNKLSIKKETLTAIQGFFEASKKISEKEFKILFNYLLINNNFVQACWKSSKNNKKRYSLDQKKSHYCNYVDPLISSNIIEIDNKKMIIISKSTRSFDGKQLGTVSLFFTFDFIKKSNIGTKNHKYLEFILLTDNITNQFHSYNIINNQEIVLPSNNKNLVTFTKDLDTIGRFSFSYISQIKSHGHHKSYYLNIFFIALLILIVFFYFYSQLTKKYFIEKKVREKTVELKSVYETNDLINTRLKLVLEASKIGVWHLDLLENKLVWDNQMFTIYGYENNSDKDPQEIWEKRLHPSSKIKVIDDIQKAIHKKIKLNTTFSIIRKDGNIRVLKSLANVFCNKEGSPISMTGVNWDITEEREWAKKIKEKNRKYQIMVEGAGVGIWDWKNIKKDRIYCNSKFYELLGYKENEFRPSSKLINELFHSEDREMALQLLENHLKNNTPFNVECRIKTKSSGYHWFKVSGLASQGEENESIRMVGSIQDINEKILSENELKRSNEELDQFAYITSHDLREPLRGMRNFSQFLIEDYEDKLDAEGIKYLQTIKKLGIRLESYLDSLLHYSRLGRDKLAFKPTNIKDLINEAKETFISPNLKDIKITVEGNIPIITCDPVKMLMIFGNLFQNAIRYNLNEHKIIKISHQKLDEKQHQFNIEDNGIGIKKDHWERIFTIFKRLHPKEQFEGGTGVGLTLVKRAIEKHHGEIWVESSKVDTGTTFSFTIRESKDETI